MLPKEHGAYGQVTLPLLTALVVAGPSTGGLLIALAAVAGFLAHEPVVVLLGERGPRAARDLRARAIRWLVGATAIGLAAGLGAVWTMPPGTQWLLAVPLVPALAVAAALRHGLGRSWHGETAAALAFSGVAIPVAAAAPAPVETGAAVAIPFALLFVGGTLAVRAVILRVRSGGDLRATRATRVAALALVAGATAVLGVATTVGVLSAVVLVAAMPGLLTVVAVVMRLPAPNRLRPLGWTLMAASVVTAAVVIAFGR